ncbi:MAG: bifunctional folylpolyglutamate synthase/dihydrofolate synthase [Lentisphaeria bacterium]|nr:bifunctional folylpolyglutamate synthase/dihydrofolate synthase [Lentisphaeria bacterium]
MTSLYRNNLEKLDARQMFGIKLGLEQTAELFRRCGAPLQMRYLHIAGTNGKGSCGAMLDAALRGCGFRTGFYSSPHLIDPRERVRINGAMLTCEQFNAAFARVEDAAVSMKNDLGAEVTYFEFATALAAVAFQQADVDFVIWETGMGGTHDATSVVDPEAAIITNIALDHQRYLGETLAEIAGEKAGIFRSGVPAFCGILPEEAQEVVRKKAAELQIPLTFAEEEAEISGISSGVNAAGAYQEFCHKGRSVRLHLHGAMQRRNYLTILPVLEFLGGKYGFSTDRAVAALQYARWPGRVQQVSPRLIVDGGHNPDGVAALVQAMEECYPRQRFTVIFAGFKDKDVRPGIRLLAKIAARFVLTPLRENRETWDFADLAEMIRETAPDCPVLCADNAENALRMAEDHAEMILAAGSLYLAGEILESTAPETVQNL